MENLFRCALYSFFLAGSFANAAPLATPEVRQNVMRETLYRIRDIYYQYYAHLEWKNEQRPHLIRDTYLEAEQAIADNPDMTKNDFRQKLFNFVNSTRDYHIAIRFYSTETSLLPFTVHSAEKKVFVGFLHPSTKEDPSYAGVSVGDQIVSWNGQDPYSVLEQIINLKSSNNPETDLRLSEFFMTSRFHSDRLPIEKGTFVVKFRRGTQEFSRALTWKYTREEIPQETPIYQSLVPVSLKRMSDLLFGSVQTYDDHLMKLVQLRDDLLAGDAPAPAAPPPENPFRPGGRISYVPKLGQTLWETEKSEQFRAYIYLLDGKTIGYFRVPSFMQPSKEQLAQIDKTLRTLQEKTDALVLDTVANPGGSVLFTYGIISRLVQEPAFVPPRQIFLNEEDGYSAAKTLREIAKTQSGGTKEDEDDDSGYEMGTSFLNALGDYSHFVLDQLRLGRNLTDPYPYQGISKINPHSKIQYTKPILMLIDGLDISCGDIFPIILKDSGRVTLFGTKTSGASGYLRNVKFPNQFGIDYVSVTFTKPFRKNGEPIENQGVEPDIEYSPTVEDLQGGFAKYRAAVNKAVQALLVKPESKP